MKFPLKTIQSNDSEDLFPEGLVQNVIAPHFTDEKTEAQRWGEVQLHGHNQDHPKMCGRSGKLRVSHSVTMT